MRHLQMNEIYAAAEEVAKAIATYFAKQHTISIYPVPRGGIPAYMAVEPFLRGTHTVLLLTTPDGADVILDDLYDSGATMKRYRQGEPYRAVLFSKKLVRGSVIAGAMIADEWVVFPWEGDSNGSADDIPRRLLQFIGEDPARGGLLETPKRFLKAWREYSAGYGKDAASLLKVFEDGAEKVDEMVLVKNIPVYSHCEHHLAPFFGVAHVAYIPNGRIVGLSKLSRLVDMYAKRLQVQERLNNQIADALEENLKPLGVGVVIECRHLCMESRGIQRQGSTTVTSAMRGALRDQPAARAELMALINK
jgi:GTP cyclohydrolase I